MTICEVCIMKVRSLLWAMACSIPALQAQTVQLELSVQPKGHESIWYLHNTGTATLDINSLVVQSFYRQQNTFVQSLHIGRPFVPGGNTFRGSFRASGRTYTYKQISNVGLDTALAPGDSVAFLNIANTDLKVRDTVLVGGVVVNYNLTPVTGASAMAYPRNGAACKNEFLFLDAGVTGQGIKYHSFLATNVNYGTCEPGAVIVVFDGQTLERKPIPGFTPQCYWGRAWMDFSFPENFQVFYSANLNTAAGRLRADSLIRAVPAGDYIAWFNHSMVDTRTYSSLSTTLGLFGVPPLGRSDSTPGYLAAIGRKGLAPGLANFDTCSSSHLNCNVKIQQAMVGGAAVGTMPAFAACFEMLRTPLGLAPEEQSVRGYAIPEFRFYPNPGQGTYRLSSTSVGFRLMRCTDLGGREVQVEFDGNVLQLNHRAPAGVYLLQLADKDGRAHYFRLIRE